MKQSKGFRSSIISFVLRSNILKDSLNLLRELLSDFSVTLYGIVKVNLIPQNLFTDKMVFLSTNAIIPVIVLIFKHHDTIFMPTAIRMSGLPLCPLFVHKLWSVMPNMFVVVVKIPGANPNHINCWRVKNCYFIDRNTFDSILSMVYWNPIYIWYSNVLILPLGSIILTMQSCFLAVLMITRDEFSALHWLYAWNQDRPCWWYFAHIPQGSRFVKPFPKHTEKIDITSIHLYHIFVPSIQSGLADW